LGPGLPYLPHVDGLRAIAVALVVAFHAFPALMPGGFVGVDVFFVISGFIITRQIAAEMAEGRFSYLAFLGRRIRRLVPAALVCFLLVSVAAALVLAPEALREYGRSLQAAFLMVANYFFLSRSDYFAAPSAEMPLLHTWSLAVEDQFYLAWPLVLLAILRFAPGPALRLLAVATLALASLAYAEWTLAADRDVTFFSFPTRAFELLTGCALALAIAVWPARAAPRGAGLAGLAAIAASATLMGAPTPAPGLATLPLCLGTALVIWRGHGAGSLSARALSLPPVRYLGWISYSLYLYHWPLFALGTYHLGRAPDAIEAGLLVALALALAAASYALVEQRLTPSLGLAGRSPWRTVGLGAAATGAMVALGVAMVLGKGWPWRFHGPAAGVYEAASAGNPLRVSCDGYRRATVAPEGCIVGKRAAGGAVEVAIFGDSNADHFVPMLAVLAERAGLAARQVTQSACAPLIGLSRPRDKDKGLRCVRYHDAMLAFIDRTPGLKVAILSAAWDDYEQGGRLTHVGERYGGGGPPLAAALERTLALFRERDIRVVILGQVPHLRPFSLRCFAAAAERGEPGDACATPRAEIERALAPSRARFAAAARDRAVTFVDVAAELCSARACGGFRDGVFLYRDANHLNATGSRLLADVLAPKLALRR
jgi:peptidoglycan/LPS O-acetylase OafA/YrhL